MKPNGSIRPPTYQIVVALFSAACLIAAIVIGANVDHWHGIYVRAVCALLSPIFLLMTMYYPAKSVDDHRRDHPDDDNNI